MWEIFKSHVMPLNDIRDHLASPTCWCSPTPDNENPTVYIHHSLDYREKLEETQGTA